LTVAYDCYESRQQLTVMRWLPLL